MKSEELITKLSYTVLQHQLYKFKYSNEYLMGLVELAVGELKEHNKTNMLLELENKALKARTDVFIDAVTRLDKRVKELEKLPGNYTWKPAGDVSFTNRGTFVNAVSTTWVK